MEQLDKKVFLARLDRNVDISDMDEIMDEITVIKSVLTKVHPYISMPCITHSIAPVVVQLLVIPDTVALELVVNIGLKLKLSFGKKHSNRIDLTFIYSWK